MSLERRRLMLAYGATFDLTPKEKGMKGAIARAEELIAETPGSWMPQQFENPANLEVHAAPPRRRSSRDFRDSPIDMLDHRRRHRRPHHRLRRGAEGANGRACRCSRSSRPSRRSSPAAIRARTRSRASAPASSPRSWTRACSTASSRSIPPTPRRWPAAPRARKACWSASARARRSQAIAQKLAEIGAGKRVLGFNYDTGERYLSVPDFLPE